MSKSIYTATSRNVSIQINKKYFTLINKFNKKIFKNNPHERKYWLFIKNNVFCFQHFYTFINKDIFSCIILKKSD